MVTSQDFWIKPRSAERSDANRSDVNENVLSEQARDELGLSEELVRKGVSLENVLSQVNYTQKALMLLLLTICTRMLINRYVAVQQQCIHLDELMAAVGKLRKE